MKTKLARTFSWLAVLSLFLVAVAPAYVEAASEIRLYLTPSTVTLNPGQSTTLQLRLSKTDPANVDYAEADLTFPANLVEVSSISWSGSSFTKDGAQVASYDNGSGTISLKGESAPLPTPTDVLVATITFRARSAGTATVAISASSKVGTLNGKNVKNYLTARHNAVFSIVNPPAPAAANPTTPPPAATTPATSAQPTEPTSPPQPTTATSGNEVINPEDALVEEQPYLEDEPVDPSVAQAARAKWYIGGVFVALLLGGFGYWWYRYRPFELPFLSSLLTAKEEDGDESDEEEIDERLIPEQKPKHIAVPASGKVLTTDELVEEVVPETHPVPASTPPSPTTAVLTTGALHTVEISKPIPAKPIPTPAPAPTTKPLPTPAPKPATPVVAPKPTLVATPPPAAVPAHAPAPTPRPVATKPVAVTPPAPKPVVVATPAPTPVAPLTPQNINEEPVDMFEAGEQRLDQEGFSRPNGSAPRR